MAKEIIITTIILMIITASHYLICELLIFKNTKEDRWTVKDLVKMFSVAPLFLFLLLWSMYFVEQGNYIIAYLPAGFIGAIENHRLIKFSPYMPEEKET